jgi:pimeloyl-ACP methyl ester carboxylesterase
MKKIFIVHGWTYDLSGWKTLVDMLSQRGFSIVLLKVPGLTDGTNPIWTLEEYVEWLKRETAGNEKVILIGHSNGGRISLAFAAKYPERVERLILEDSAGIPPRGLRRLKRDIFKVISNIGKAMARAEWMRNALYELARESDYRRATPEMRKTMANLLSIDLTPVLSGIKLPTLIVWGARDRTTPPIDGDLMHKKIPNSKLIVLPDAAHSPHRSHPHEMADIIEEELKRV